MSGFSAGCDLPDSIKTVVWSAIVWTDKIWSIEVNHHAFVRAGPLFPNCLRCEQQSMQEGADFLFRKQDSTLMLIYRHVQFITVLLLAVFIDGICKLWNTIVK